MRWRSGGSSFSSPCPFSSWLIQDNYTVPSELGSGRSLGLTEAGHFCMQNKSTAGEKVGEKVV